MTTTALISVVLAAITVLSNSCDGRSLKVTLYEGLYFSGDQLEMNLEDGMCYNLPDQWINEMSSFKMDPGSASCIVFYRSKDCDYTNGLQGFNGGTKQKGVRKNLNIVDFNDVAQSVRKCGF